MAATKGSYVTRGRGIELERRIEEVRRELGERVAAAEARAAAAEQAHQALLQTILTARKRPAPKGT